MLRVSGSLSERGQPDDLRGPVRGVAVLVRDLHRLLHLHRVPHQRGPLPGGGAAVTAGPLGCIAGRPQAGGGRLDPGLPGLPARAVPTAA